MLDRQIAKLEKEAQKLPEKRKELLARIASEMRRFDKIPALHFICTHNSRRSQLAQVWAKAAAHYAGFTELNCYSGGTVATHVPMATLIALKALGFIVDGNGATNKPLLIQYADDAKPIALFSKRYDHPDNPVLDFLALMTCDEADKYCPVIPGSLGRFALNYQDPKISDGTADQAEVYQGRAKEIGVEMVYLFNLLKK